MDDYYWRTKCNELRKRIMDLEIENTNLKIENIELRQKIGSMRLVGNDPEDAGEPGKEGWQERDADKD